MLTLYHSPRSRATRAYQLLDELGVLDRVTVETVAIARQDGSGEPDPRNPHPEGKVPTLVHDGEMVWESAAIFLYLTDMFPEAGLGPLPGQKGRGGYLSWLAWYGDVLEPVVHFRFLGIDHPGLFRTFRGYDEMAARLVSTLETRPYLLGDTFSAADLLIGSTFGWLPQMTPDNDAVRDWVARVTDRPAARRTAEREAAMA
ncbi:glutathione S-transferase family protein [Tropicimonas sp. IMCC34043]|uniref:glutathione S-transferase family protein n=1 Tax=Tropicimonas sp. IMCC34043 TaxID=2248760 RepID=UPI000E22C17A|nr:glutathione S-transferase family protein [Tropicimonas sp. IMCC34043]